MLQKSCIPSVHPIKFCKVTLLLKLDLENDYFTDLVKLKIVKKKICAFFFFF